MLETIGRFHVVVVHFPIALLLVGGALELWNVRSACERRAWIARRCFAFGAASAVIAAVLGWIHADHVQIGGADAQILWFHRWSGIAAAVIAVAGVMLARREGARRAAHMAAVALAMLLVAIAGKFGGDLVYGGDFLFGSGRSEASAARDTDAGKPSTDDPDSSSSASASGNANESSSSSATPNANAGGIDYASQIRPILEANCYACHGERKKKGALRLDQIETAFRQDGDGAWIIQRGNSGASELVRRVTLPVDDEDHMPSGDHEPLTPAQIELLRKWIDAGAPTSASASPATPNDTVQASEVAHEPVAPPPPARDAVADAVETLAKSGVLAQRLAQDSDSIEVDFHLRGGAVTDEQWDALADLAPVLAQLNLAQTTVTDADIARLGECKQLEQLNLSQTAVGDAALEHISKLPKLEVLNLFGTQLTDRGLARIALIPSLKRVYVWQSQVTEAGAAALATLRPDLAVQR